jgi:hypothetical protein
MQGQRNRSTDAGPTQALKPPASLQIPHRNSRAHGRLHSRSVRGVGHGKRFGDGSHVGVGVGAEGGEGRGACVDARQEQALQQLEEGGGYVTET